MPGIDFNFEVNESSSFMYFAWIEVIFKSGSMAWYKSATTEVSPFIADRTITNAAVVKAMAIILIHEMILIALFDFFEIKYRLAIKKDKFNFGYCLLGKIRNF